MAKKKAAVKRGIQLGATALSMTKEIELVPLSEGFKADVNGLTVEGSPKFGDWAAVGKTLRVLERGAQFALGDFVRYGEDRFGEQAAQVLDAADGWSEKTIGIYSWLASRIVKADRRMDRLGVAHHLAVATLSTAKQRLWLAKAAADDEELPWTVGRLKAALKAGEDLPPSDWFVIVRCKSGQQQSDLLDRLEREGFSAKASTRRRRKKEE